MDQTMPSIVWTICSTNWPPLSQFHAVQLRKMCIRDRLNVAYRRRRADEVPGMRTAGSSHLVKDLADSLPFELKMCIRDRYTGEPVH